MPSVIFQIVTAPEKSRAHFCLERTRPDAIRVNAAFVGERWEIEVFEDDHIEISRFYGSETVEGGIELLLQRLPPEA